MIVMICRRQEEGRRKGGLYGWTCCLVAQLCLTLCDPMYCSFPGPSVHDISQARILEWIAISFSRWSSWPRNWTRVSCTAGRPFTIWATREGQLLDKSKLQWGITPHQSEWPSSKSVQVINAGEKVEKKQLSFTIGRNVNCYTPRENSMEVP